MAGPRAWIVVLFTATAAPSAMASQPPQRSVDEHWQDLIASVAPALARCGERAIAAGVYGDVRMHLDPRRRCTASPSRSLGAHGAEIAACMQRVIADQLRGSMLGSPREVELPAAGLVHVERVGTPAVILPAPGALLPAWRQAVAGALDTRAAAQALGALLPPDYTVSRELCLVTDRDAMRDTEDRWLSAVGPRIPPLWASALAEVLHAPVSSAAWIGGAGGALVTSSARGLCLVPFGPDRQAAMRARFDAAGRCWAGDFTDILLQPRIELPADRRYRAVSVRDRRVCAVTTAGEVVCCGSVESPLPPPHVPVESIALGERFACGLDAQGAIRCWGDIADPPPGAFQVIRAGTTYACGLRGDGSAACWGNGPYQGVPVPRPPAPADFVAIAAEQGACAVRRDGTAACWGPVSLDPHPPGRFRSVAVTAFVACGIRTDATIGCWHDRGDPVDTPIPDRVVEVVVGGHRPCGRRLDGTVACGTLEHPGDPQFSALRTRQPPGKFVQLAAHGDTFCGVRADGGVSCWGDPWPGEFQLRTPAVGSPPATPERVLTGRVVDEAGRPIAGAEVLACSGTWPCASASRDGAWMAATLADLVARQPAGGRPGSTVLATTGDDGRWTAQVASPPDAPRLTAVVTAPHREIVERIADPYDPGGLRGDVVLRPASSLDIDARCVFARCTGKIDASFTHHGRDPDAIWLQAARPGTHIARLAPGSYTVVVRENRDEPGERRGEAVVEVPFAPQALRALVVLVPVGTGRSIRGTAVPDGGEPPEISATCASSHERELVRRHTRADRSGRFELVDVGAPPCHLVVGRDGYRGRARHLQLDRLPPTDVVVPLP